MNDRLTLRQETIGSRTGWLTVVLFFMVVMGVENPAGADGFRWWWTCDFAKESTGDRQGYFEALQGTALLMIDKTYAQAARPDAVGRFSSYVCKDGVCIQSLMEELSEYERIYADIPVVPLEWQEFAVKDLDRFRSILQARHSLQQLVNQLHLFEDALNMVRDDIELVVLGNALYTGGTEEDVQSIISSMKLVERLGFVVVDGNKDLNGNPVDLDDGRFYMDINLDIREVLQQMPYARENPECVIHHRLFQVHAAGAALIAQYDMMLQSVNEEAPILDMKVQTSLGQKTLAQAIETDIDLETFRWYMRQAFPELKKNLSTFASKINGMTSQKVNELARMPMVRAAVLSSTGDRFKQIDCIINSETPWDQLFFNVAYTIGGVAGVATMIFFPESAPLVLTALSWAMIPVAAGDTVRLWNEFKNAKTGHYTSVFRPGILGRAEVERSRLAFWVSAFGLALDVVLTPIETLSLIKARAARQAAHADDLAPISFPDKDPLDGIPWEQRLGGQLPDGQIIPGVYCGGIEAVDDIPVNFFPKEVQEGFRNKHWDKVSMMYVSHSPWEVPEDLLTNNNEGLYKLMQEMTIGYNKEFAAYRRLGTDGLFDEGPVYLMIGAGDTVELPADAHLLAHTHPSGNTWMSVIAKQEGDKIVPMPIRQGDLNVSWYHNPKNPDIVATIITPNHIVSYRIPYNTKIPVLTTYGWVEMETVNLW